MKNNPYVGPRPYERKDRANFYGRNREARDLLALILAERVVLFYAQSGAGKTSLLNAQVIPALEEDGFYVLPMVRVGSALPPDLDPQEVDNVFVFSALMGLAETTAPDELGADELANHTLASFLRQIFPEQEDGWAEKPPILLFDQFEELFTTHRNRWQDARGFFEQLRDALQALPSLGVVFAMREDYVAEMDAYAPLLPRRLRARFRMQRMGFKGALEAVKLPALKAGVPFDPGVAERLVDDLRRIKTLQIDHGEPALEAQEKAEAVLGPYVEPVQLQVVCNRLWDNLPEQDDQAIQWEEVEEFGDIDRALTDFYESGVARCVEETEVTDRQLRRWVGESLITPMETRGLVLRGGAETEGLPNQAVDILAKQHLIRSEVRAGGRWYELAHDRLVDPVLQSNRAWEMAQQTPLRLAARRWHDSGQDPGILYRGKTLKDAALWALKKRDELEPYELEFLEASRQAEKQRARMLVLSVVGAVLAVLVIILISTLAMRAEQAKWRAREAERLSRSRQLAQHSMRWLSVDREQSILLARMALKEAQSADAQIALRQAMVDFYPARVLGETGEAAVFMNSVSFSPDGGLLAAGVAEGQVQIWNTETGRIDLAIKSPGGQGIWAVDYGPDGRSVAVGGDDGLLSVWDGGTGETVASLTGHEDDVFCVSFSPDGQYLASGDRDNLVHVWDVSTQSSVATLTGHSGAVRGLDYHPDGVLLASASWDDTVRLWQLSASAQGGVEARPTMTLTGHTGNVNSVAFSPDGSLLASGSDDKTIRLWNVQTGEAILTLIGHRGPVRALTFSPDGQFLMSGAQDSDVRIWDIGLRSSEVMAVLTGHATIVNGVAYSPDGRFLASASGDKTIRLWDSRPSAQTWLETLRGHVSTVTTLAYSPDSQLLASGGSDGTVRLWSAATGELLAMQDLDRRIWSVAFSPECPPETAEAGCGRYLAAGASNDLAYVWDVSDLPAMTLVMTLTGHTADVNAVAYSPGGRYLATASEDGTARIWDVAKGEIVRELKGASEELYTLAYSPDGRHIAAGSRDSVIYVWDASSGELLERLSGHEHWVYALAYSPDGRYLASGSWDQTARIWNTETYATVHVLSGHSGYVYSVAYGPDGRYLVTSSWDQTLRIWDLASSHPQTVGMLIGHTGYIPALAYSPDGKYIASGSLDSTIRRYLARFEDVLNLSWQYVPRELTPQERFDLLGEEQE